MTAATAAGRHVADAMVTCPKTHGPESGVEKVRAFFEDDHVHMVLIVAPDGRLVTTIEQPDLTTATSSSTPVAKLGTLTGRTARPADPLGSTTAALVRKDGAGWLSLTIPAGCLANGDSAQSAPVRLRLASCRSLSVVMWSGSGCRGAVLVPDDGDRLLLGEPGAGGDRLIEAAVA